MKKITRILLIFICLFFIGLVCSVSVYADEPEVDETPTETEEPTETVPPDEEQQENNEVVNGSENSENELNEVESKIQTVIVEKAYEVKDWIIAFAVAFLSSGTLLSLVMGIVKTISNKANNKIDQLEKTARFSKEQAEAAKKQLADLSVKVETEYLPALESVVNEIKSYVQIEELKSAKAAELLEKIVAPILNELKEEE